jgi:hypothetical protein
MNVNESELMDNIIPFPKDNNNPKFTPNNLEEIDDRMKMLKYQHIFDTLDNIIPILFTSIATAGFDMEGDDEEEDELIKDGAFIIEAIKSFLCQHHGIDHPFQTIAENVFSKTVNDEGLNVLRIVEHLDVKLKEFDEGNSES